VEHEKVTTVICCAGYGGGKIPTVVEFVMHTSKLNYVREFLRYGMRKHVWAVIRSQLSQTRMLGTALVS
jgi:hypothetical protein